MNGPEEYKTTALQENSPLGSGCALGFFGFRWFLAENKERAEDDPGKKNQYQGSETDTVRVNGLHLQASAFARNISSETQL
jgi:hypothetical protein